MFMTKKSLYRISLITILILVLLSFFATTIFRPFLSKFLVSVFKNHARGQYVCTLDNDGVHVGQLYKINKNEKKLLKTYRSNSCIFSRPTVNAGFFVFAIGGGGGATPFESGSMGQIISSRIKITKPVLVIKIGKGGNGTYINENNQYFDAKDGEATTISELKIRANGGSRSTRMTPLGNGLSPQRADNFIPQKYLDLYKISADATYGLGGEYIEKRNNSRMKFNSNAGNAGVVIIQW